MQPTMKEIPQLRNIQADSSRRWKYEDKKDKDEKHRKLDDDCFLELKKVGKSNGDFAVVGEDCCGYKCLGNEET